MRIPLPLLLLQISQLTTYTVTAFAKRARSTQPKSPSVRHGDDLSLLVVERQYRSKNNIQYLIGSDDSGRGTIAGPVVTASVCLLQDPEIYQPHALTSLRDAKLLTPELRREIYDHVASHPERYAWNIRTVSNRAVDELNVLKASMDCFADGIDELVDSHEGMRGDIGGVYAIVDGQKSPKLRPRRVAAPDGSDTDVTAAVKCKPWIKGDSLVYTVALASVLARVAHDDIMTEMGALYPEYGLGENRGYQTDEHIKAIHKFGPCPIHRMSTKALKGRVFTTYASADEGGGGGGMDSAYEELG